ncbi:MAG: NUDIX domain-containing protein [Acidimicrobiia bacterium]|nr:NUDIX domain-containing protein [Acidimicrobiia bacterium]
MSNYLRELRALVGDRELLLPAAAVVITDPRDRLLLVRQSNTGDWSTVGGMIEPGESPMVAAARETHEEVEADVDLDRLLGVFGGPGYRVDYPNGHRVAYVVAAYSASLRSTPRPDGDEVTEIGWFSSGELAALDLSPLNRTLLVDLGWITGSRAT